MTSGHTGSCGRWRTRSRAARPRSSRTSSPSACSVCHGCADRGPSLNFDFTDDQKAIKRTAHDFLAARYTSETIRELARDDRGFTDAQWQALVELGWPGVIVPEEHDGLGLGAVELIVIAEEMGYGLAPSPLQSNTCAALLLIAAENVGVAQRAMEMAVAYAGDRKQFGRPIGAYQAVSHRCAQMLLEVESARSLSYWSAWALDHEPQSAVPGMASALTARRERVGRTGPGVCAESSRAALP